MEGGALDKCTSDVSLPPQFIADCTGTRLTVRRLIDEVLKAIERQLFVQDTSEAVTKEKKDA